MTAALIMAGGRSERMRAGGSQQHKGLRTVAGMPLIEWNVRALRRCGVDRIFVAVSAREDALVSWIAEQQLEALIETRPLGTIGAVASLPRAVENAVVVNVDNLTTLDLRKLARFHAESGAAATIATHKHPFPVPFGMLELDGQRIVAYREKPALPVPISSGVYVLHRRAIDCVPAGYALDVPALVEALLAAGETVLAWPHHEAWIDVNDEGALARAQQLFPRFVP